MPLLFKPKNELLLKNLIADNYVPSLVCYFVLL